MSRMPMLVSAGLAMGGLVLSLAADLAAQTGTRRKTRPARAAIQPVEATEDTTEAPPPRARTKPRTAPAERTAPENARSPAKERLPLPEAQPMRVPKLSAELEQILADWEVHSSQIKKLTGNFERHKYDHTFKVEFSAHGKFAYEAPDRGAYEFEGTKVAADALSRKQDENKEPYSLKSDQPEHWVCTGDAVLLINHKDRNFTKVDIPPEHRGENIIDGPLPFLFGMKAEQAKRRYDFKVLPPSKKYPDEILLGVTPRLQKDSSNWCEAQVIIDRETYLPIAVRLVAPGGNSETIHHFRGLTVNGKASLMEFFGKRDPFNPDLRNYKPVLSQKDGPAGDPSLSTPDVSTRPGTPGGARVRVANPDSSDRDPRRSADTSADALKKPPRNRR